MPIYATPSTQSVNNATAAVGRVGSDNLRHDREPPPLPVVARSSGVLHFGGPAVGGAIGPVGDRLVLRGGASPVCARRSESRQVDIALEPARCVQPGVVQQASYTKHRYATTIARGRFPALFWHLRGAP